MPVLLVKQQISVFEPPFGALRVTYAIHLWLVGEFIVDIRVIIKFFSLALTDEVLIRRNRPLLKGWVTLGLEIRLKGYVYRQHLYTVR